MSVVVFIFFTVYTYRYIYIMEYVNIFYTLFNFFNVLFYSSDRDYTVQGVRRQVQRSPLRRDHMRGVQRIFPAVPVVRGQLPVSAQQKLRGGPR